MISLRAPLAACALAALLVAPRAFAQEPSPGAPAAPSAQEDEARAHFTAGVNLVRDPSRPRYDEAYLEFKKAYALASSPKILGNLGLCAMKLERDAEAIAAYSAYLKDVPDLPAGERAQIERDLSTLRATIANVTVESTPAGATIFDTRIPVSGDPVTNSYGPINARTELGVRRGHHVMKARFPNGRELVWEAEVQGGETHIFDLPPDAPVTAPAPVGPAVGTVEAPAGPTRRPVPGSVFVVGGISAALGIGALATGLVALSTHSEFEDANDGLDPSRADDLKSRGQTLNVVSDVLLVSALVGAGITAYLYFTRPAVPVVGPPSRETARSPLIFRF